MVDTQKRWKLHHFKTYTCFLNYLIYALKQTCFKSSQTNVNTVIVYTGCAWAVCQHGISNILPIEVLNNVLNVSKTFLQTNYSNKRIIKQTFTERNSFSCHYHSNSISFY